MSLLACRSHPSSETSSRQVAAFTYGTTGFYYNPPTIANGHVYIGTSHKLFREPDGANRFFELDMSLAEVWHYDLGTHEVRGAATVDGAGNVYFVVETGRTYGTSAPFYLYSLTPNGQYRWSVLVDSVGYTMGMSNPAVAADDTVYVGGGDGLYAFAPDGTQKWKYTSARVMNAPIIDPAGNVYFVAGPNAVSVTPGGAGRWTAALNGGGTLSSPAFSTDQTSVFVACGTAVYRFSAATGALVWQFSPPGMQGEFRATPAIDYQDNVYVGSKDNQGSVLYAVRADGTGLLWENPIGADLYSSPALGNDGTLYVGSEFTPGSLRLHAIDLATGEMRWSAPIAYGDVTWSSPALAVGGTLYIATMACDDCANGAVLAFDTDSTALMPGAGSPRFHEGNAGTGRRE